MELGALDLSFLWWVWSGDETSLGTRLRMPVTAYIILRTKILHIHVIALFLGSSILSTYKKKKTPGGGILV